MKVSELSLDPFDLESDSWHGEYKSLDGVEAGPITASDVAEILYHGSTPQDWDGCEAVVMRLRDGRLVAYETSWGPTGNGFSEDAYGGDANLYFASANNLKLLVNMALTDEGRRLANIPQELCEV
jgi:hypothetical protein